MPQNISIRTAQNVIIEFEIANVWDRVVAYIIDGLIIMSYLFFTISIIGTVTSNNQNGSLVFTLMMILMLPLVFYSLFFEVFNNGQSPGKSIMNIQVVSLSGKPVSLGQYFLRWIFRIVDFYLVSSILAVLVIALNEKGQRIGDIVAGTSVISKKRKKGLRSTIYAKLKASYKPSFPQVVSLTPNDIQIIKDILSNRETNRFELITRLAAKAESIMGVKKESSSETFLKLVVKDFNYYQSLE